MKSLSYMFLIIACVAGTRVFADSFTMTKDGKEYLCSSTGSVEEPCYAKPGTTQCGDWVYSGKVTVKNPYYICSDPKVSCAYFHEFRKECRTFDGCGTFKGSYSDTKQEGTGYYQDCSPC